MKNTTHSVYVSSARRPLVTTGFILFLSLIALEATSAENKSATPAASASEGRPPFLHPRLKEDLADWTFSRGGTERWHNLRHAALATVDGSLFVRGTDGPPVIHRRVDFVGGRIELRFRIRTNRRTAMKIAWMTRESPLVDYSKAKTLELTPDGQWHDVTTQIDIRGHVTDLQIGFTNERASIDIKRITLTRRRLHPLAFQSIEVDRDKAVLSFSNTTIDNVPYEIGGQHGTLAPKQVATVELPVKGEPTLETVIADVRSEGLPDLASPIFIYHEKVPCKWLTRPLGDWPSASASPAAPPSDAASPLLSISADGRLGKITRGDRLVALLAPIVHCGGRIPEFTAEQTSDAFLLKADDAQVRITCRLAGEAFELQFDIQSDSPCEGPVVRVQGRLQQGLMPGSEFLGPFERSSMPGDVGGEAQVRYLPDRAWITMPMMALATDRGTLALGWDDASLQPLFASPDVFDGSNGHRMSLRSMQQRDAETDTPYALTCSLLVESRPIEKCILWAVRRRGLPEPLSAPRDPAAQEKLSLRALKGVLRNNQGWAHAAEEAWPRRPFADFAAAQWRMTGQPPTLSHLTAGGSLIPNDSFYFATNRVFRWLDSRRRQVQRAVARQKNDGAFPYRGATLDSLDRPHLKEAGLPTDTVSGICSRSACEILNFVHVTGAEEPREAGLKALEYIRRFKTPRGGMFWSTPVHAPDLLAAANLVNAYLRGYELTGDASYLEDARRWAIRGLPFVYLWDPDPAPPSEKTEAGQASDTGRLPSPLYTTPPAYAVEERTGRLWLGRPAPWVGIVYAEALVRLARHDDTLDWRRIATGILHSAERMQYDEGPMAGCMPYAYDLHAARGESWHLNPTTLVYLRRALEDRPTGLSVLTADGRRVCGPFPMHYENKRLHITAAPGLVYQLLLDGHRVIDVQSEGNDVIELE